MKKIFSVLTLSLLCMPIFAQRMTDANGNNVYYANVAVIVKECNFSIQDGKMYPVTIDNREALSGALNLYYSSWFSKNGFNVINNDKKVNDVLGSLIKESQMEEYIDGLTITAQNLGAQFLFLVEYTTIMEENQYITTQASFRLINTATNMGFHRYIQSQDVCMTPDDLNRVGEKMVKSMNDEFHKFFREQFLPLFAVSSIKGSKVKLFATRQIPLEDLPVDFYKWYNEDAYLMGSKLSYCTLDYLGASSSIAKAKTDKNDGALVVTAKDKISAKPDELLAVLGPKWFSVGTNLAHLTCTFAEMAFDESTMEGYAKHTVNQAVFNAISKTNQLALIESDLLPEVKAERERQKSESFMNTDNQYKTYLDKFDAIGAKGAMYLFDIDDFKCSAEDYNKVSFIFNVYDVSAGTKAKSFDVSCHLSNINEVMQYNFSKIFVTQISMGETSKKDISFYTPFYINANVGDEYELMCSVEHKNPTNGESVFERQTVAILKYAEWKGQKHVMEVAKVLNKEVFNNIKKLKERDQQQMINFTIAKKIDEPKNVDKDNSAFAKYKKVQKAADFLNKLSGVK